MKTVNVKDAVGMVLCHDMTQIIKGKSKGPRFKKGHIIKEEDVEVLLSMGKENIYVYELSEDEYHENDAAMHLAEICQGDNIYKSDINEGKINLLASCDGLLKVDINLLNSINSIKNLTIATKRNNKSVKKDQVVAGTRIIPLTIDRNVIKEAERLADDSKILEIKPYIGMKAGIVTTGNEVYYGRIEDGFTDIIRKKIKPFNIEEKVQFFSRDNVSEIISNIRKQISLGCEIIFCAGGMSVDPDDNTPGAIYEVCDEIVSYGAPVLPGSMFMLGYAGNVPIVGLPGCVMFSSKTVFDLVLPRLAARDRIYRQEIIELGNGGLL